MRRTRWLALLPASDSFRALADTALAAELLERCGIDVRDGFGLMPHDADFEVRYTDQAVGWLRGDLVGPDAFGEPVAIAWVSRHRSLAPISPQDEVRAEDIRFFWHKLPVEALRARYGRPFVPPFSVTFPAGLEVHFRAFTWPEIFLRLTVAEPLTPVQEQSLTAAMREFRETWNAQPDHGLIHGSSLPQVAGNGTYELHIDFGSAATEALGALLATLATLPGVTVTSADIGGSSLEGRP